MLALQIMGAVFGLLFLVLIVLDVIEFLLPRVAPALVERLLGENAPGVFGMPIANETTLGLKLVDNRPGSPTFGQVVFDCGIAAHQARNPRLVGKARKGDVTQGRDRFERFTRAWNAAVASEPDPNKHLDRFLAIKGEHGL